MKIGWKIFFTWLEVLLQNLYKLKQTIAKKDTHELNFQVQAEFSYKWIKIVYNFLCYSKLIIFLSFHMLR